MIDGGRYGPGDRIPPEPEIASQFGVSRMTANKAILSLVAEGRLIRRKRHGTFVAEVRPGARKPIVVVDQFPQSMEDDYFQGLYWSLQQELATQGIALQTVGLAAHGRVEQFRDLGGDPLVFIGPNRNLLDDLLEAARLGTRIVVLGAAWQGHGITAVDSDNILGAALAVNHLADLGHRNIGFLGAFPNDSNTVDRLRGFKTALAARGLAFVDRWAVVAKTYLNGDPEARARVGRIVSSADRPTAYFAAGGHLPSELIGIAEAMGLRIPQDLSVVGYDDPPFAARSSPPLTTIRQPLAQMAAEAAALILEPSSPPYRAFEPELKLRATTARL